MSDDIGLSIDQSDADALEEGVEFKRTYNAKLSAFDALSSELSQLVQQFTRVDLAEEEESGEDDSQSNERIIEQINREQPYSIDEDFKFKRPHGLILDGQATTGITNMASLVRTRLHHAATPRSRLVPDADRPREICIQPWPLTINDRPKRATKPEQNLWLPHQWQPPHPDPLPRKAGGEGARVVHRNQSVGEWPA